MSDLTVFGEFDQYEINESYKSEKEKVQKRYLTWTNSLYVKKRKVEKTLPIGLFTT